MAKVSKLCRLTEFARKYGDVYSLKMAHANLIVLSSQEAVRDIMEKNSAIVSDRPPNHFTHEITQGDHMGAARYGVPFGYLVFNFSSKSQASVGGV